MLSGWKKILSDKRKLSWLITLLVIGGCFLFLFIMPHFRREKNVREGYVSRNDIVSLIDFNVEDVQKTKDAHASARRQVPLQFRMNEDALNNTLDELKTFAQHSDEITGIKLSADNIVRQEMEQYAAAWANMVRRGIIPEKIAGNADFLNAHNGEFTLVVLTDSAGTRMPETYRAYCTRAQLVEKILEDLFRHEKNDDLLVKDEKSDSDTARDVMKRHLMKIIRENMIYDGQATDAAFGEATRSILVERRISKGQVLIAKGVPFRQEDVDLYNKYLESLDEKGIGSDMTIGNSMQQVALILGLILFLVIYIFKIHPAITHENSVVWLLLTAVVSVILDRFFFDVYVNWLTGNNSFLRMTPDSIMLILPLAVPALLIGVIFGFRAAIYAGIFTSGVAAVALDNSFPAFFTGLFTCCAAAFAVRHTSDYKTFFTRALMVCMLLTLFCGLIFYGGEIWNAPLENQVQNSCADAEQPEGAGSESFWVRNHIFSAETDGFSPVFTERMEGLLKICVLLPLINGVVTSFVSLLLLFLLEMFPGLTSNMSYKSFTDRNHELLKLLRHKAPGTYVHSEAVAQLADAAAKRINLSPAEKVQACALFHDIGKIDNPFMFTENQRPDDNPHDHMTPQKSVAVIRSHVTDGMAYVKKFKLPALMREAVECHHGNDFVGIFYKRAQDSGACGLKEEDFRYQGRPPVSREATIVSLADCCEAAVKSLKPPIAEEAIRDMVKKLFRTKMDHGQLDKTELSLKELNLIREAFIDQLLTMHKQRVAYKNNGNEGGKA